jgi:ATP-dependent RNA helicase DDX5/DBP2
MSYYGGGGQSHYNDAYGSRRGDDAARPAFSSNDLGAKLNQNIQWETSQLAKKKFEKNFYFEHPAVQARSEAHTQAWRESQAIKIHGEGIPKPCLTFEEASIPEFVLNEVEKLGFPGPTPIQSQGW